jgi:hypothetical protein
MTFCMDDAVAPSNYVLPQVSQSHQNQDWVPLDPWKRNLVQNRVSSAKYRHTLRGTNMVVPLSHVCKFVKVRTYIRTFTYF